MLLDYKFTMLIYPPNVLRINKKANLFYQMSLIGQFAFVGYKYVRVAI